MKKVFIFLILLLLFLATSVTGAIWYLNGFLSSDKGFQWILEKADEPLRDNGVKLKIDSGSLKLFSGLQLKNLDIVIERAGIKSKIIIPSFDIHWELKPFSQKIILSKFHLVNAIIEAQVETASLEQQEESKDELELPQEISFQEEMDNLPFEIIVEDILIKNLKLTAQIIEPQEVVLLDTQSFNFQMSAKINNTGVFIKQNLSLEQSINIEKQKIQALISGKQDFDLFLTLVNNKIQFDFNKFSLDWDVKLKIPDPQLPKSIKILGSVENKSELKLEAVILELPLPDKKPQPFKALVNMNLKQSLEKFIINIQSELSNQLLADLSITTDLNKIATRIEGQFFPPLLFMPKDLTVSPIRFSIQNINRLNQWKLNSNIDEVKMDKIDISAISFNGDLILPTSDSDDLQLKTTTEVSKLHLDKLVMPLNSEMNFKIKNEKNAQQIKLEGFVKTQSDNLPLKLPIDLNISMEAEKTHEELLNITKLQVLFNESVFTSHLRGKANIKNNSAEFTGEVKLDWPKKYPEILGIDLEGKIQIPWELTLDRAKNISLQTAVNFDSFNLKKDDIQIQSLNGRFPVSEEFKVKNNVVSFSRLLRQNAFERVAFSKIRPFLVTTEPLRIKKIMFDGKIYGPFVGFVNLHQNLLTVNKFDLSLSKAAISGESFFDLQPSQLSLGFLTRFSQLSFSDILPKRYLKNVKDDKPMSGRTNLVYNLSKSYINGRMDVTDISSNQLIAAVNVLDPEYQDDNLNIVRNALSYAYPTYVGINFNHSYMDMDVTTNLFKMPRVRSLPIGVQLNDVSQLVKEQLKEVPFR